MSLRQLLPAVTRPRAVLTALHPLSSCLCMRQTTIRGITISASRHASAAVKKGQAAASARAKKKSEIDRAKYRASIAGDNDSITSRNPSVEAKDDLASKISPTEDEDILALKEFKAGPKTTHKPKHPIAEDNDHLTSQDSIAEEKGNIAAKRSIAEEKDKSELEQPISKRKDFRKSKNPTPEQREQLRPYGRVAKENLAPKAPVAEDKVVSEEPISKDNLISEKPTAKADSVDDATIDDKPKGKVLILWDLDNLPPLHSATDTVKGFQALGERFGQITEIAAYANRYLALGRHVLNTPNKPHAYYNEEEQKLAAEPLRCPICGKMQKDDATLRRHFRMLHSEEQWKRLKELGAAERGSRKKEQLMRKHYPKLDKYRTGVHYLNNPGIEELDQLHKTSGRAGLFGELERANVKLHQVNDIAEAADQAIRGRLTQLAKMPSKPDEAIKTVILASDDIGFASPLLKTRALGIETHIVGSHQKKGLAKVDRGKGKHRLYKAKFTAFGNLPKLAYPAKQTEPTE